MKYQYTTIALITSTIVLLLSVGYKNILRSMTSSSASKLPVYFISSGGPSFMYENDPFGEKGAFKTLKQLGHKIENEIKPAFIIIVSAHWQSSLSNLVEIDIPSKGLSSPYLLSDEDTKLIYDFSNFPPHYYKEQFHSKGSKEIAEKISDVLQQGGFQTKLTSRGLDHGSWVAFKVAFTDQKNSDSHKWDVSCPVVQVSLTSSPDHDTHYKLGQLLSTFREQNGLIIGSGMSVHNLPDLRRLSNPGAQFPYLTTFNSLLKEILQKTGDERLSEFNKLDTIHKDLYTKAHPGNEHFLPVVVTAGAAENEVGKELYNAETLSLGWGYYEFNG